MADSKAGERTGGAGRQREEIGGEIWEERRRSKRDLGVRKEGARHGVRVKVRYTEVRKGKNPEAKGRWVI